MSGQLQTKAGDLDKAPLYVVCADVWDKCYQAKWVFREAICSVYKDWLIVIVWMGEEKKKKNLPAIMFWITCSLLHLPDIFLPHGYLRILTCFKATEKIFGAGRHKQGDPPERHCFACIWRAALCLNPIVCWRFSHQIKLSVLFCLCACLIKVVSGWNSRYADISIPTACIIAVICFPFG